MIRTDRATMEAAFTDAAESTPDGRFALVQPLRVHVLTPAD